MVLAQPVCERSGYPRFGVIEIKRIDSVLAAIVSLAVNVLPFYLARVAPDASGQPIASPAQGMAVEFVEISLKANDETAKQKGAIPNLADDGLPVEIAEKTNPLDEEIRESGEVAEETQPTVTSLERLSTRYADAIRARILASWQSAGGEEIPANCEVVITQASGGDVISVGVQNCTDVKGDLLEMAVLRAQPLPYKGFEPAFSSRMELVLSN